jgi:hypothetical protein
LQREGDVHVNLLRQYVKAIAECSDDEIETQVSRPHHEAPLPVIFLAQLRIVGPCISMLVGFPLSMLVIDDLIRYSTNDYKDQCDDF